MESNAGNQNLEGERSGGVLGTASNPVGLEELRRTGASGASPGNTNVDLRSRHSGPEGPGVTLGSSLCPWTPSHASSQTGGLFLSVPQSCSATAEGEFLPRTAFISWSLTQILLCSDIKCFPILSFDHCLFVLISLSVSQPRQHSGITWGCFRNHKC